MKKLYAIKLKGGYYHSYNLGQIVCFENKDNARTYMKYNHYEGTIEQLDIDLDKQKRIIDLEAKLAESEKALETKESVNRMYKATLDLKDSDFSDLVRENAKLKQQLTEKEAEVEGRKRLNSLRYAQLERQDKEIKELKNELEKYKIKDTVGLAQFINENSIKLAIAELEKVKEQFSGCHLNGNSQKSVSLSRLYKIINSQIKNLKERSHE